MRQHPPPLLQRLSTSTGGSCDSPKDERELAPWVNQYTPSIQSSSLLPVTDVGHCIPHDNNNNIQSASVPAITTQFIYTSRSRSSSSSGAPLFSSINMFKMGTKSKSPRRAASDMYPVAPTSAPLVGPSSPTRPIAVSDPLQRPFSSWGSSDSQSSTSPRNSTRMSKGAFNKRTGSPTASVSPSNAGTSKMSSRSKSFLNRGRKNLQSNLNENVQFDPTTLRKNRTRPAWGKGQDALYGEYEDLFDDSLDEDVNEDSLTSDGNEDEDGFLLLRVGGEKSPISPRARSAPRSVPMPNEMRQSGSDSPPPPIPPPKSWRRSLDVTTPPRSATASVDEPLTVPHIIFYDAPPTPPPKPTLYPLITNLTSTEEPEEVHVAPSFPPPPQPPPAAPAQQKQSYERVSQLGESIPVPDGLGIINIPSPTLFYSSFIPGASDTWTESPSHTTKSPALTSPSYTPRQPAYETNPADDEFIPKGLSLLFDETDNFGVLPLFNNRYDQETSPQESVEMTQLSLDDHPTENPSDVSASTNKSIGTLMETLVETTDTFKEVKPRVAEDDRDAKEVVPKFLLSGGGGVAKTNGSAAKPEEASTLAMKNSEDQAPSAEKEEDDAKDSSYLRAFRAFIKGSGDLDPFVHRMPRYDALQAQRICSHLRKDYPLIVSMNKRKSSSPKLQGATTANARQREVGEEILTSLWALMALRWMNYGRVVISPGHETLLAASAKRLTRRATVKMDQRATQMLEGVAVEVTAADPERRRVLDLGGLPIADWGWHCAYDYPKAKVYTVTTRTQGKPAEDAEQQDTPLSADKYRGPKNHRHLIVSNLWRLPFPPNHFDVVSARTIYLTLKTTAPSRSPEQTQDEYDLCLEECLRVLKPGGHLEFSLLDNDIINAGPLGSDLSKKFAESLLSKSYDPVPTKRWVSRLNRAGFGEIKRTWLFLPMAPPSSKPKVPSKGDMNLPLHESQDLEMVTQEVRRKMESWEDTGAKKGTLENASPITGLVGSWVWEKWMLKISAEANDGEWQLAVDTVGQVLSEAKEEGSGWRSLVGWARKPLRVGQH